MRVKAFILFKGKFYLKYIGRLGKNGVFKFRNKQLRKAVLNTLKWTFNYDCLGGSLTIPNGYLTSEIVKRDKYVTCYSNVMPQKENSKYIVTYWKK